MIDQSQQDILKNILFKKRPESDALSPFVFRKVNLRHLEVDKELTFRYRKVNNLDHQYFREQFGKNIDEKLFADLDVVQLLSISFKFLSNESRRELAKIEFYDVNDSGEDVLRNLTIEEKYGLAMVSDTYTIPELLNLLLNIFSYTDKMIKEIFDMAENPPANTEKKSPDNQNLKSSQPS